ncbi:MAG TPA: SIR2 family protein [Allosphingosinicella sp.]|nr:SIR2 family protein [Allosphingosinicella sp.]
MINIGIFGARLQDVLDSGNAGHAHLKKRVEELDGLPPTFLTWSRYRNFWPPTVMEGLREGKLIAFAGAGVSVGSSLPGWRELLEVRLGVPPAFLADEYLKSDNLTLGEISARILGRDQLQYNLRKIYSSAGAEPTTIHYTLAALNLSIYITTNYDTLFETAWKRVNKTDLAVICNWSDAILHADAPNKLYKIHGSAERIDEMLVLTRSDYRQHYRANEHLFSEIKEVVASRPTIFTGFSHTDPEISRLVDDVIYAYEKDERGSGPALYNMQFDSTYVVNERFAAKGLVSLTVRRSDVTGSDVLTAGVAESLAELADATGMEMDRVTSLDAELAVVEAAVRQDLSDAIDALRPASKAIAAAASGNSLDPSAVEDALATIVIDESISSQGLYVVDAHGSLAERGGKLVGCRFGKLDANARTQELAAMRGTFSRRPYFQSAKSFRRPFVSDFFESAFNKHSTFAICTPIIRDHQFIGLLFAAAQVGQWRTPLEAAARLDPALGVYLLDGQGLVAMPPNREFGPTETALMRSEPPEVRTGFPHVALRLLSRKDRVVLRLAENIVPVEKDDDVLSLDKQLDVYTRVQNVRGFAWRCAVARTIEFTR